MSGFADRTKCRKADFKPFRMDGARAAYTVAYFFEYMGVLVAYGLVPSDFVIDFSANMLARSWYVLQPFVESERRFREKHSGDGISAGFVSHFEHLVALTLDSEGKPIDQKTHEKLGLQKINNSRLSQVSYPTERPGWQPAEREGQIYIIQREEER